MTCNKGFAGALVQAPAFLPAQASDLGREKGRASGGKETKMKKIRFGIYGQQCNRAGDVVTDDKFEDNPDCADWMAFEGTEEELKTEADAIDADATQMDARQDNANAAFRRKVARSIRAVLSFQFGTEFETEEEEEE